MDILFLIGRIIFGGYFIYNGLNNVFRSNQMSEYSKMKGTTAPPVLIALSGLMIICGGLSLFLGAYPAIGVILLALFLIPITLLMHKFWAVDDPQIKMLETVNFTKNFALLGALMMFLKIPTPWPLSVAL